ncbi:SGNH/GDSL hydrolase family protein [Dinghuibacter silviterrae]|uniref:GDSL-like lipase/acylhydrolase family protein n=1 Tax=Dinghuibacter silviterrae TaxID=1539049 RepID=A0A4R8DPB6_9BACT|nr:SGNH/GDSL hydrolase family protein [Dinghuibacter silviterrae]TDW99264.1 GDSL-like lipase/acylhydrolase family protein [Dinghuibacter silviterrae]
MRIAFLFLFNLLLGQCTAQIIINNKDTHIHYMGRVDIKDSASVIAWPGTSLSIRFTGSEVKALLDDERGDNFFNIVVDGKVIGKLHPDAGKNEYVLVSGLGRGIHTLTLFKRTEWENGKTWFYHFTFDKGAKVLAAPPTGKHKLEFFGDSITSGYAVEDSTGQDRGSSPYKDNYVSYAAITARHFGAEYHCTSKSGIGILVSWFPLVMPEMYDRLDATNPDSKWDFSRYTPDIVVVNLFQNDSWLTKMPANDQFKAKFDTTPPTGDQIILAYARFIRQVRSKYPDAHIICALGSMDATREGAPWPGYITKAVASLQDKNIYTCFFPYKNTPGHPNVREQQDMAERLIGFIHGTFGW